MEGSTRTNLCYELPFALDSTHFHALVCFMAVFLKRRAAVRYRALASIIPDR